MTRSITEIVYHVFSSKPESPPRVIVVGDLILDRYLWGEVERVSPEAPVPVVRITRISERLGGGANVAANVVGLGLDVILAGHVGLDADAKRMEELLEKEGIKPSLTRSQGRATTTKTRILGGHQQMLRLDQEDIDYFTDAATEVLLNSVLDLFNNWSPSIVILSDYAKGSLRPDICQALIETANRLKIPILVDPKGNDYAKYRGATALTPNQKEAAEVCKCGFGEIDTILNGTEALRRELNLDFVAITRGEYGIALVEANGVTHLPATTKQVFDVSGAGDTVIATLAAGMISGLSLADSCRLANLAAGIVVGKVGTVPVRRHELIETIQWNDAEIQTGKICDEETLMRRVAYWRDRGEKIVFTNGCFDLIHAGHVAYLGEARKHGDRLVIGLNTDRSVKALKGDSRPIVPDYNRARVLAAMESVDAVVLFDEDTPERLICRLLPDVLVKGGDYRPGDIAGGACVRSGGGVILTVDYLDGQSTSNLIEKIILLRAPPR